MPLVPLALSLGSLAQLNATVTDDGLPNPPGLVTTLWSVTSGPGPVIFGDLTAVDTTAAFSVLGTYVLRLTADDSELTHFDEITIVVSDSENVVPEPTAYVAILA